MAVEDHPKYPEWRRALERMIDANDQLKALGPSAPKEERERLQSRLELAKIAYCQIAIDLD